MYICMVCIPNQGPVIKNYDAVSENVFKLGSLNMAYTLIFLLKKCKATHIFFSKNTCELNIVFTRTVNILTTNKLLKLTML